MFSFATPIITISRLAAELDVSYEQASKAIAQLEEVAIVGERTGHKRNRVFVAEDVWTSSTALTMQMTLHNTMPKRLRLEPTRFAA